jgi:hypothetical protein
MVKIELQARRVKLNLGNTRPGQHVQDIFLLLSDLSAFFDGQQHVSCPSAIRNEDGAVFRSFPGKARILIEFPA